MRYTILPCFCKVSILGNRCFWGSPFPRLTSTPKFRLRLVVLTAAEACSEGNSFRMKRADKLCSLRPRLVITLMSYSLVITLRVFLCELEFLEVYLTSQGLVN